MDIRIIANEANTLILASASPRRAQLLRQLGIRHRVLPAHIDESRQPDERVEQCVQRLAAAKARSVFGTLAAHPGGASAGAALPAVLGADTEVVIDGELLGKPADRARGIAMLARLSGRTHEVLSAVTLISAGSERSALSRSAVTFRALEADESAQYWDSGEPRDKAGGYAIQGLGAQFVAHLSGSFSGVMGLPLFETATLLRAAGLFTLLGSGGTHVE